MEREKRQKKLPETYVIPKVCYPRIRKKKPRRKTLLEASYQMIPVPLKFVYTSDRFAVYGDIGLKLTNNALVTETGVLNEYLWCCGVEIIKEKSFCTVNLSVEKKFQIQLPPWQYMVESLQQYEHPELKNWGERIKRYSLQHEESYRALQNELGPVNGFEREDLIKITEETKKKMQKFLSQYPCIALTSTQEDNKARVRDICFNDRYLQELGYSLETFSSVILQEGIPQMLPKNNGLSAKILLDNYYNLGRDGCESPEFVSDLVAKNGFPKRIRYKVFYLPSYREKTYDVTAVLIVLGKEKPLTHELCPPPEINKIFLKNIISKEKDTNKFLKKFYNKTLNLPYTSEHKVCKIRELNVEKEDLDLVHEKF